jgi:hypothetical protein
METICTASPSFYVEGIYTGLDRGSIYSQNPYTPVRDIADFPQSLRNSFEMSRWDRA